MIPLLLSLLVPAAPAAGPSTAAVAAVLDDFHDAAAKADEERYFGHFAEEAVFLGTDATERWDKAAFRAYAQPHFAKGKGWTYRPIERHVSFSANGAAAWFDERLRHEKWGECRGSGALVLRKGRWLVVQYNLTVPVPNELLETVVGMIREGAPKTP